MPDLPADGWFSARAAAHDSGQAVPIRRLVDLALSQADREIALEVDPALLRPVDAPVVYGSCEKARTAFGFRPRISLEQSVGAAWLAGG